MRTKINATGDCFPARNDKSTIMSVATPDGKSRENEPTKTERQPCFDRQQRNRHDHYAEWGVARWMRGTTAFFEKQHLYVLRRMDRSRRYGDVRTHSTRFAANIDGSLEDLCVLSIV